MELQAAGRIHRELLLLCPPSLPPWFFPLSLPPSQSVYVFLGGRCGCGHFGCVALCLCLWRVMCSVRLCGVCDGGGAGLGQTKQVLVKRFVFKKSVEQRVCELHDRIRVGEVSINNNFFPGEVIRDLAAPF